MLAHPALPARERVSLRMCSSAGEALPAEIAQRMQQPEPVVLAVLRVAVARGLRAPFRPELFEPIGIDEGDDPPATTSPRTVTPVPAPAASTLTAQVQP
jgi:hypothetical protein